MDQFGDRDVRVWIVWYEGKDPADWREVPPGAIAQCEAFDGCYARADAAAFVEGFNNQMLLHPNQRWAVARRVKIRIESDFEPGEPVDGRVIDFGDWPGAL